MAAATEPESRDPRPLFYFDGTAKHGSTAFPATLYWYTLETQFLTRVPETEKAETEASDEEPKHIRNFRMHFANGLIGDAAGWRSCHRIRGANPLPLDELKSEFLDRFDDFEPEEFRAYLKIIYQEPG